ncbi:hypothetical protein, conserved [Eimeria brunetti]|uniref:Uncharacterized protein n=1 Tax=Eimeria brunetti TaxID=51314 RepID=U6LDK6_9EIME|nr:hypothetical protein, conserved [Eimeria brunetti]
MAELQSALAARQQKGEADQVFEAYGKRQFTFKEGKRGAQPDPQKVLSLIQVHGVPSPTEPLDLSSEQDDQQPGGGEEHPQPSEQQQQQQQQEQQQQEQQQQEQQQQQQDGQQQQDKGPAAQPQQPAPERKLHLAHRHDWV